MSVLELVFLGLTGLATVRALTTAMRKLGERSHAGPLTFEEQALVDEDTEHWVMAFLMNSLLLAIAIIAVLSPHIPRDPMLPEEKVVAWILVLFALGLNIRIERHGYYYRKRNRIDFWGRPR